MTVAYRSSLPPAPAVMSLAQEQALQCHARFGRNPSSLVMVDEQVRFFACSGLPGGVPYHAAGPVWMAGEPLAPSETLPNLMEAFVRAARASRRTRCSPGGA